MDIDWQRVRLVVFDVDGTLYDARRLRSRMIRALLSHCLRHPGDLGILRRISTFRRCREELAEEETVGVGELQYRRPAEALGVSPEAVRRTVEEWIMRRPLLHLKACRYAKVADLFDALRRSGRGVAVLSDYPAGEKLAAMGLSADPVICALDDGVDRLKPHPRGLERLLEVTGVAPEETLLVGDRDDRDGECARRAGVRYLLRTGQPSADPDKFGHFGELVECLHSDTAEAATLQ